MKRFSVLFILFFLSLINIQAQDDDVIKVDSSIVRLNVGVVDRTGKPIINLNKENFTVYEDGVKQPIARFEPTVSPFSVVMLLDMSGSTTSFRPNIRLAATRFLDALAPEDRVAVIEFYSKVNVLNDFTTDRRTVINSINVANGRGDTNLYKALQLAQQKLSGEKKQRRKAIVVLTDGVDTPMQNNDRDALSSLKTDAEIATALKPEANKTLVQILNQSDREGITIFPLALPTSDPKRLPDPTSRQLAMYSAARERLQIMANRTGGTLNAINRLEEMSRLYALVAAEIRTLYTIEYQPLNDKRDNTFRKIKIEVTNPELIARTREGYFAGK